MDFISDIAGVAELLIFIFGLFMWPLSDQSFDLNLMKRLYYARSSDDRVVLQRDPIPDPNTGKVKRNVKFDFDKDDENKIVDNGNHKGL
jgi:hypothetical protein|tara:strand:+ start:95 stop:361 length:267 start_codon:yes stop_codon:yes gene_type:complete